MTRGPRAKGTGRMEDNTETNQPCTRYDRLPIAGKSIMPEGWKTALHTDANELNGINTSMVEINYCPTLN